MSAVDRRAVISPAKHAKVSRGLRVEAAAAAQLLRVALFYRAMYHAHPTTRNGYWYADACADALNARRTVRTDRRSLAGFDVVAFGNKWSPNAVARHERRYGVKP